MANSNVVYARIDQQLKTNAEAILAQLGISPSSAIQMFYTQVVQQNGIPFDLKLKHRAPLSLGALSQEELNTELAKGLRSIKEGRKYTDKGVDRILSKELGI